MIIYESVGRLGDPPELEHLGIGIAVIALLRRREPRGLALPLPPGDATDSPALEGDAAHLRTDAYTSIGVLVGSRWSRSPA